MKNNKHIGSNFDEFLKEEGLLEEIEDAIVKRLENVCVTDSIRINESDTDRVPSIPPAL